MVCMVERFGKYRRLKLFALRPPRHITRRSAMAVRRAVFEVYKMTRKTKQSGDFVAETMTGMRSEKSSVAVSSQESEVWLIMIKNLSN